MSKAKATVETVNDAAEATPGEYGPITWPEWIALPEDVRQRRAKRAYEKLVALRGKVHIDIDIDELRGRRR